MPRGRARFGLRYEILKQATSTHYLKSASPETAFEPLREVDLYYLITRIKGYLPPHLAVGVYWQ